MSALHLFFYEELLMDNNNNNLEKVNIFIVEYDLPSLLEILTDFFFIFETGIMTVSYRERFVSLKAKYLEFQFPYCR